MARTRESKVPGSMAGSRRGAQARQRARQRIAAERRRAQVRRRLLVAVGSVAGVLAIVVSLVAVKLTSAGLTASEALASASVVRGVTSVPAGVLARTSPGQLSPGSRPYGAAVRR